MYTLKHMNGMSTDSLPHGRYPAWTEDFNDGHKSRHCVRTSASFVDHFTYRQQMRQPSNIHCR